MSPLLEDEDACPVCGETGIHQWDCPVDPVLDPLPPERSQEELGFSVPRPVLLAEGAEDSQRWLLQLQRSNQLAPARERRVPEWESDQRAHYAAMGFEFPSGLLARVRELAP